jgi:hypothetical protein
MIKKPNKWRPGPTGAEEPQMMMTVMILASPSAKTHYMNEVL